jgi:hypothetical protein
MPKRSATSQPVDSPTAKRKAIEDSYDRVSPFCNTLLSSIEGYTWDENEIREDYEGQPEKIAESLSALRNLYEYNGKNELSTLNNAMTRFQARAKGAMTRNRVLPAMLSADPTDLRQAVQFCVNWEWGISNYQTY